MLFKNCWGYSWRKRGRSKIEERNASRNRNESKHSIFMRDAIDPFYPLLLDTFISQTRNNPLFTFDFYTKFAMIVRQNISSFLLFFSSVETSRYIAATSASFRIVLIKLPRSRNDRRSMSARRQCIIN